MRKTRGGWGETGRPLFPPPPSPFPSRARLNFTFNTFPLRIVSESLAQASQSFALSSRSTAFVYPNTLPPYGVGVLLSM